jgi:hypothetical protein
LPSRLALPLLLAVLALAAWFLFFGGGDPAPDAPLQDAGATVADVEAAAGTDAEPAAENTARTTVDHESAGGNAAGFDDPALGIPSFVGRALRSDGSPAAGAEVRALGLVGVGGARDRAERAERLGADWTVRTRADGRFALPESPRDGLRFELVVLDAAHAPLRLQNLPSWPGRTRDLGDLTLARGFAIAGRVTSPEGAPVAGASVLAYPDLTMLSPGADLGQVEPLPMPAAVTDREGAFALARLGPDRVRLRAESSAGFSPWSAGVGGAEGETVGGIDLQLLPTRALEGVVLSSARAGLAGIRVRAEVQSTMPSPNGRFQLEAISDTEGAFRFALPQALRSVDLSAGGEGTWIAQANLRREEDFAKRVELVLAPMPALRGFVLYEPDRPAEGVKVALATRSTPGLAPEASAIVAETVSAADGGFTLLLDLSAASANRFQVVAWNGTHLPAQSESIRLRPDGRGFVEPKLVLVLREGLTLAGRALTPDGAPVGGARALLRKLHAPRTGRGPNVDESARGGALVASAATDADGAFRYTGLPAGDYRVELHHRAWSPSESDDLPLAQSLEDVEVRMHPASGILGEVEGDLHAAPPLQVLLRAPGRDPLSAPVDALGSFTFAAIAPDVYALELHAAPLNGTEGAFALPGGVPLGRLDGLEVLSGQQVRARLALSLEERGTVAGEVRNGGDAAVNYGVFLLKAETTADLDPRIAARNAVRNMRATQTDHQGRFRIAGAETGDHLLVVCAPGQWPNGMWDEGGARDPRGLSRRLLRIDAGSEMRADFLLRSGTLRIEVANADQGVSGQQVEITPLPTSDEGYRQTVNVARNGVAGLVLPSGPYSVSYAQEGERMSWQVFVPADAVGTVSITLPLRAKRN